MDSRLRKRTTQIHTQGWRATEPSPTTNDALEKRDTWRHPLVHIHIIFLCWTIPWPAAHYFLIVILSINIIGILDSASAYESKFLFQTHFPLSATKQRSTRKGGGWAVSPGWSAVGVSGASADMVPFIKKEEDMDDTTTLSTLQSVFFLFTFLLVVNQIFVDWPLFTWYFVFVIYLLYSLGFSSAGRACTGSGLGGRNR